MECDFCNKKTHVSNKCTEKCYGCFKNVCYNCIEPFCDDCNVAINTMKFCAVVTENVIHEVQKVGLVLYVKLILTLFLIVVIVDNVIWKNI